MLECGVDIRDVTIVILVQPYGRLHAIVQACGRCGRVNKDGTAKKSALDFSQTRVLINQAAA